MAEQLDSLLKKIQDEAVQKADEAAKKLATAADAKAKEIVANAEKQAQQIVADAEAKASLSAASGRKTLEQAARDTLILLRKAVTAELDAVIRAEMPKLIPVTVIQEILVRIAAASTAESRHSSSISVLVNEQDHKALATYFLKQFKEHVEHGVTLNPMKGLKAGFKVSLADKDVVYDFSDEAMAAMLSHLVGPAIEDVMKKAVDGLAASSAPAAKSSKKS